MGEPFRILLVDDEVAVTRLLAKYLERLGYAVDICLTGEEGLERFSQEPAAYALVLTDLSLPGLAGDEMLRRMLTLRPSLPAIVSSGYPFSVETLPVETARQIGFLQKPYLPNMLAELLSRMLKTNRAAASR